MYWGNFNPLYVLVCYRHRSSFPANLAYVLLHFRNEICCFNKPQLFPLVVLAIRVFLPTVLLEIFVTRCSCWMNGLGNYVPPTVDKTIKRTTRGDH